MKQYKIMPAAASKTRGRLASTSGRKRSVPSSGRDSRRTLSRSPDTTPPVTIAEIIGTGTGYNNCYRTASVKLTATDDDSGVALTEFTVLSNVPGQGPPTFHPLDYLGEIMVHTGSWTVYFRSKDNAGNLEPIKNITVCVDNDPPQVDFRMPYAGFTKLNENMITEYGLGERLMADYLVVDYFTQMQHVYSGVDPSTVQASVANGGPLDTSSPGLKSITVSADDYAGNHAKYVRHYRVTYHYVPIRPPPRRINTIKPGHPVPVEFQLKDHDGNNAGPANALLYVASVVNGVTGRFLKAVPHIIEIKSSNRFNYDAATNSYVFQMSTEGMPSGKYCLKVKLDDGTEHLSYFTLLP